MNGVITEISSAYGGRGFVGGPVHMLQPSGTGDSLADYSDGSASSHPFDVTVEDKKPKIADGVVYVGSNKEISVEGISIAEQFTGDVFLKISWSSSGTFEGQLVTTNPGTPGASDNFVSRKLYSFEDGKVKMDYRLAPVFVLYN